MIVYIVTRSVLDENLNARDEFYCSQYGGLWVKSITNAAIFDDLGNASNIVLLRGGLIRVFAEVKEDGE